MANFNQAIEWMKEGKKVTMTSKVDGWYCYSNPQQNRLLEDFSREGGSCELSIIEFESNEWELYKDKTELNRRIDVVHTSLKQIEELNGSFILKEAIKLFAQHEKDEVTK